MRDSLIYRKFNHFRVNENEFYFIGLCLVKQADDYRVYADGFTRTGCARDKQVRHFCNVNKNIFAADVLAESRRHF